MTIASGRTSTARCEALQPGTAAMISNPSSFSISSASGWKTADRPRAAHSGGFPAILTFSDAAAFDFTLMSEHF